MLNNVQHFRKNRRVYERLKKASRTRCPYFPCTPTTQPIVYENATHYTIRPPVPYDLFEGRTVLDHLIAIPKRHVVSLANFTQQEKLDHITIVAGYEKRGYSVYIRGVAGVRSIDHQHTHLLKIKNEKMKFVLYNRRPYIVVKF